MDKLEAWKILEKLSNFISGNGITCYEYKGECYVLTDETYYTDEGKAKTRVSRIEHYPVRIGTKEDFESLVPLEDDIFSVVQKVGLPSDESLNNSLLNFYCKDEISHTLKFEMFFENDIKFIAFAAINYGQVILNYIYQDGVKAIFFFAQKLGE